MQNASQKVLIERLEKATGPDRELDAEIFWLVSSTKSNTDAQAWETFRKHGAAAAYDEAFGAQWRNREANPPWRYTELLDRALMLVPEGWQWQVSNRAPAPKTGRAYIHTDELIHIGMGGMTPNPKYRGAETTAATPALALCITALKARAVVEPRT